MSNTNTVSKGIRKVVMQRAHEIARTLEGDYRARMSYAMKQAWAEAKEAVASASEVAPTVQQENEVKSSKEEGYVFLFGVHPEALPNQGNMNINPKRGQTANTKHAVWHRKMVPTMVASICKAFEGRKLKELMMVKKWGVELLMADVWPFVLKRHPEAKLSVVSLTGVGEIDFSAPNEKGEWTALKALAELRPQVTRVLERPRHLEDIAPLIAENAAEIILFGTNSYKDDAVEAVKTSVLSGIPSQLVNIHTLTHTVLEGGKVVESKKLYGDISFDKGESSWKSLRVARPTEVSKQDADRTVKEQGLVLGGLKETPQEEVSSSPAPVSQVDDASDIPVLSFSKGGDDF